MQIKQRLHINSVGIAVLALAIILVFFVTAVRVKHAAEASKLSNLIFVSSYERLLLRTDLHRTSSERTKVQLIAKHKEVGALLRAALQKFPDPEDQKTVRDLLAKHESIGYLSKTIRERRDNRPVDTPLDPFFQETENLLLSQLNTKVYESILLQGKLNESGEAALRSSLWTAGTAIILVLLAVSSLVLVNSIRINRLFAGRIRTMREGTAVIGGGSLDHLIDVAGDDEFSELAGSFNEMTARLRESYLRLEKEIEERKQAEEALRQTEEKFSKAFANNPAAIALTRLEDGLVLEVNETWLALCGFKREEIVGRSARALGMWPSDEAAQRFLQELREKGEVRNREQEFIDRSGRVFCTQFSATLLHVQGEAAILATLVDISERKRAEEELKGSLSEKEVLLKEVHHRVKNNLQVISSLVSLQAAGSTDETVREVLNEVSSRVRSMALVHEKLYQSHDLAHIDFADYLRSLLTYIWRANGAAAATVHLTMDLEPVALPVDTAVPCGLIVNELAANALKHAFKGRAEGEVTVSLKKVDKSFRLRIADNGVGLPAGLDWRKASSLGLRLVQMLAGQLEASVEMAGDGETCFEISVPARD